MSLTDALQSKVQNLFRTLAALDRANGASGPPARTNEDIAKLLSQSTPQRICVFALEMLCHEFEPLLTAVITEASDPSEVRKEKNAALLRTVRELADLYLAASAEEGT